MVSIVHGELNVATASSNKCLQDENRRARLFTIHAASELTKTMASVGELNRNQYLTRYKPPEDTPEWGMARNPGPDTTKHGSLGINNKGGYYAPSE